MKEKVARIHLRNATSGMDEFGISALDNTRIIVYNYTKKQKRSNLRWRIDELPRMLTRIFYS